MAEPWSLLWVPYKAFPGSWEAMCNGRPIGTVLMRDPGDYHWKIDAVSTKFICKGYGDTMRVATAKRALELNWKRWLDYYGLEKRE